MEDAEEITKIKTIAFNKEINTYLGRDGGPPGYNKVESEIEIIDKFLAYKIVLDNCIIGAFFFILKVRIFFILRILLFILNIREKDMDIKYFAWYKNYTLKLENGNCPHQFLVSVINIYMKNLDM